MGSGQAGPRNFGTNHDTELTFQMNHSVVIDHVHLRRLLRACAEYYNTWQTNLGLDKDAPVR